MVNKKRGNTYAIIIYLLKTNFGEKYQEVIIRADFL